MKNEKEWIEHLRNRMEGYSEPLPEGLWDTLSKELKAKESPKVIPMWRRWQAVAAVLALLVVSSLTLWFSSTPDADFHHQKLAGELSKTPLPEVKPIISHTPIADAEKPAVPRSQAVPFSGQIVSVAAKNVEENVNQVVSSLPEERELEGDNTREETTLPVAEEEKVEQTRTRKSQEVRKSDRKQMEYNAMEVKGKKEKKSSGFSLGVGAGNTPYSSLNTFEGMGSFVARSAYYTSSNLFMSPINNEGGLEYSQVLLENAVQAPQTSIKHHVPVTVGLSFAWHFHKDWSLETGLNYTLLSSDIHSGSKSYVEETQKLHYVGIPVKLRRSIWKNNWLSVYASAGGAVEKCVSGTLETATVTNSGNRSSERTSLNVKPLQWSVAAAAGAQVNFTPRFGFYVEPGAAYYFDDGSEVETIRKEHPLNFNLQLGLRVNVTK